MTVYVIGASVATGAPSKIIVDFVFAAIVPRRKM